MQPFPFIATITIICLLKLEGFNAFKSAISFNFTFYCDYPGTWCGELYMTELDMITTSEPWMYASFCTNESQYELRSETMRGGGDGVYQNEYEISNVVFHNCTRKTHKSSYNYCQYNTILNECYEEYQIADRASSEHQCQCATSPTHRRIPINTVETFSETYNLTESTLEAFNSRDMHHCRYPYSFTQLQVHSPKIFPRNIGSCNWNDEIPNTKFTFVKHRSRVAPCIPDGKFRYSN